MDVAEETNQTCYICNKDLSGILVKTVKLGELAGAVGQGKIATVGVVCDHCSTRYCETHKKELNYGLLRGFTKSTCLKCGQTIGGTFYILQLRSAKENTDVPELMQVLGEMKLEQEHAAAAAAVPEGASALTAFNQNACPVCGGTKITTTRVPAGSIKDRIFPLVFGLVILALLFTAVQLGGFEKMTPVVSGVSQLAGLWFGLEMLWEGLFNRSLPFVGIRLFGFQFDTHAACADCKFHWKVEKKVETIA